MMMIVAAYLHLFFVHSYAKSTYVLSQALDKSNGSNQGHRQRAEALAALNSAFTSSSGTKTTAPRPSATGQGSQRAAAVAALSSVLTAEKKQSPDASPTPSISSPPPETNPHGMVDIVIIIFTK